MPDQIDHQQPRVLEYRKSSKLQVLYFKCSVFLIFLVYISFFVFLILQHLQSANASEASTGALVILAIMGGIGSLIFYIFYIYLIKPLTSKVQVFKDRLLIIQGKKKISVQFSEITEIKSLGRLFKIVLKNGKSQYFHNSLERLDYIVDAVVAFNPKLMDEARYFDLRTDLILGDHSRTRLYSFIGPKYRWLAAFNLLFLPCALTALLVFQQSQLMVIKNPWSFCLETLCKLYVPILFLGATFLTFIDAAINKKIRHRLRQFPENKLRNTTMESAVYRKVFPAYLLGLVGLFAIVYQYDLNTLYWPGYSVDIPHMNIHSSDDVWVDLRFNCLKCPYSLQREDNILIEKQGRSVFGKIIGLPGEIAQTNTVDSNNRILASTGEATVPQGKVAVRMNPDGSETSLVDVENIIGRVLTDFSQFLNPSVPKK